MKRNFYTDQAVHADEDGIKTSCGAEIAVGHEVASRISEVTCPKCLTLIGRYANLAPMDVFVSVDFTVEGMVSVGQLMADGLLAWSMDIDTAVKTYVQQLLRTAVLDDAGKVVTIHRTHVVSRFSGSERTE